MKLTRRVKYYALRFFRLKASPKQVARGLTLGFIPNWLPTFGSGPFISVGLAKLTRSNLLAAFVGGVVGTPFWPVLFFFNYQVGSFFFWGDADNKIDRVDYTGAAESVYTGSYLFVLGAIINIIVSSLLVYSATYFVFKSYRAHILKRLRNKTLSPKPF